jgi:predicted ATPase
LSYRSRASWILGYPKAALADVHQALSDARAIGQAVALMYALSHAALTHIHCGDYQTASTLADNLSDLADEKGALFWKASGMIYQGILLALTGKAADAAHMLGSGISGYRSTGSSAVLIQASAPYLARAYADLGQFDDAWHRMREAMTAMETTKERWCEAETHRMAGEIALMSPEPDAAKAQAYFERALTVARQQQAKSWELRAAMSMARLLRDQGTPRQARELLAPVYGWFTEGFDTLDLKEARALLDALAS